MARRLGGFHLGRGKRGLIPASGGHEVLLGEFQVVPGLGEFGIRLGYRDFGRAYRQLAVGGIELTQQIAYLYRLADVVGERDNLAASPALDVHIQIRGPPGRRNRRLSQPGRG